MKRISVAKDFAVLPFGRYSSHGDFHGEKFRRQFLVPALSDYDFVEVDFDGVSDGMGSSFLDESFGGLVRDEDYSADALHKKLVIVTSREDLKDEIWSYIEGD